MLSPALHMLSPRAARVYRDAVVIDMHNDLSNRMLDDAYDPDVRHDPGYGPDRGDSDLPRFLEAGLTAQFLAAFVDGRYAFAPPGESWARAQAHVRAIGAFVDRHPDRLIRATRAADVRRAKAEGKLAVFLAVEGGHAIENSLDHLRTLYTQGARYLTLTWNNGNDWAGSSVGARGTRTGGLTDFGRDVVREMNRLGMLVDISHASDATFHDVIGTSADPVIASHSNARALDAHPRNLTDDMLRAVARTGGVVNVNFFPAFLDRAFADRLDIVIAEARVEGGESATGSTGFDQRLVDRFRTISRPPLSALIDHIDHIARVAGVEHVGLGSDFDGTFGMLPLGMDDVTRLPLIAGELLDRGYSEADVSGILGGNMLRVLDAVLDREPAAPA